MSLKGGHREGEMEDIGSVETDIDREWLLRKARRVIEKRGREGDGK